MFQTPMSKFLFVSDFILIVGGKGSAGFLNTVEIVSPDGNPVPKTYSLLSKEKKPADEVPATEFEKIDLNEKEETKQEDTEEDQSAPEKKRLGERISTFLSKLKPTPAEKKVEKPKEESISQKRRGSETSV